jgi:serine O-acetyltransferase
MAARAARRGLQDRRREAGDPAWGKARTISRGRALPAVAGWDAGASAMRSRHLRATIHSREVRGLLTFQLNHPETVDAGSPPGGAAAGLSFRQLLQLMREDWRTHMQQPSRPGLQAVWVQRFGAWRFGLPVAARKPASLLYRVLHVFVRNVYGIEVSDLTRLGRRVWITHQGGIVIDPDAEIGDGTVIHHNVTIAPAEGRSGGAARLGRNVFVGSGAIIVGAITIGDGSRIGPNVVVTRNVPPEAVLFAPAPRTIETPRRGDR